MNINFHLINTVGSTIWGAQENIKIIFEMSSTFMLWNMGKWKPLGGIKSTKTLNTPYLSEDFELTSTLFKAKRLSLRRLNSTSMIRMKHVLQSSYSCHCFVFTLPRLAVLFKLFKNNYTTCCKGSTMFFNSFLQFSTTGYLNIVTLMHQRSTGTLPTGIQLHVSSRSGEIAGL